MLEVLKKVRESILYIYKRELAFLEDSWYNERLGMVMLVTSSLFPRDYLVML